MKNIIVNSKTYGIKNVLIDDEDYEFVIKHKWFVIKGGNTFYVVRNCYRTGKQKRLWLHREIMNPADNMDVDHKNNDGLDNRKSNLRVVTRTQNSQNRTSKKNGNSKYLGVCLHKKKNVVAVYWTAHIRVNKKLKWLGQFPYNSDGELKAAKAYDVAALKYHGEFANLNFK